MTGQLAYVLSSGLQVANVDASMTRQVVDGSVAGPSWSHSGQWIAYLRVLRETRPAGAQIEIVSSDGTANSTVVPVQPNLLAFPYDSPYASIGQVRWAPDDRAIYYQWSYGLSGSKGIKRHDLLTGADQELGLAADEFDIAPDGALVLSYAVASAGLENGYEIRWLAPGAAGPGAVLIRGGLARHPIWSPDGQYVIVATNDSFVLAGPRDGSRWIAPLIHQFLTVPAPNRRAGEPLAWPTGSNSVVFDSGGDIWAAEFTPRSALTYRLLPLGSSVPTDPAWWGPRW